MRVAIFTDTFFPQVNGVSHTLKQLGDYLEKNSIPYLFITPKNEEDLDSGYKVINFFSTPFFLYPESRFSLPNLPYLNKELDTFKPDLIFCMTEFNIGLSGLAYGKKNGLPVVSNYSTNFQDILKHYNVSILEHSLKTYLAWFHTQAQISVTPTHQSRLRMYRLGIDRVALFRRGIHHTLFGQQLRSNRFREKYHLVDKIALLYVGRLSGEKDLDILVEAMDILNQKYFDKIILVLTGDGPMKESLKKHNPGNFVFTGYLHKEELYEAYASCDIFTFPSAFETFGNVVLEAHASGLPCVGVNEGGVKDIIVDGVTGYLAKSKDSNDFADKIEQLILFPKQRETMGQAASKHALKYDWNHVFDELIHIFRLQIRENKEQVRQRWMDRLRWPKRNYINHKLFHFFDL